MKKILKHNLIPGIIFNYLGAGEAVDSFGEKLLTTDVKGNLLKAKTILKNSLPSLAAARAAISKSDKSCLCNKNYVRRRKV